MRDLFSIIRAHRAVRTVGSLVVVMATVFVFSSFVSADQLPTRSVQLSSSSAAATGVSYVFEFTTNTSASAFVIDFCTNSPLVGDECLAPAGMTVASSTTATSGYTVTSLDANTVVVEAALVSKAEFTLDAVTNPSSSGLVYARIVTYNSVLNAAAYSSDNLGTGSVDGGTVAFSITDTIGVTGSVMESVTFCISAVEIGANCTGVQKPVLELGEKVGSNVALISSQVSEGTIYAQISTNAAGGITVNLKSNTVGCGGLKRAGDPEACDIVPALSGGIVAGQARFGVKVAPAADTGVDPSGVLHAADGSVYGGSQFMLNYIASNATGVTSIFGDPFLDTDGKPANNKNVALTFGASVANNTPAGSYSADLSLIAAGKF